MTHVSRRKMPYKQYRKVRGNLIKALFRYSYGEAVLESLLTRTEKIMLAKRLAIVVMLEQDRSHYSIVHTLKISPSTPLRIRKLMTSGAFEPVRAALRGKKTSIIDLLEVIASFGMPSIAGPRETKRIAKLRKKVFQ